MDSLGLYREDDGVAAEIVELLIKGFFDVFEAGELVGRFFVQAHLFAGHKAFTFVEGVLEGGTEVHVHGGGPLACLPVVRDYAAAVVPVSGVFRLVAGVQQHLVADGVGVDSREAGTEGDQVGNSFQEFRRAVRLYSYGEARLVGLYFFCSLDGHVGHRVCAV